MKNRKTILSAVIIFTSLILISCVGSTKGKWSEADKQKFQKDMSEVQELSSLGKNKAKWIECYFGKCESNYSSYNQADKDLEGCKKFAVECTDEILSNGSVKGKWSEIDKQEFRSDIDGVEELSNFGENKKTWIECYLSKCEANFSSYNKANQDSEECEKFAHECTESIAD